MTQSARWCAALLLATITSHACYHRYDARNAPAQHERPLLCCESNGLAGAVRGFGAWTPPTDVAQAVDNTLLLTPRRTVSLPTLSLPSAAALHHCHHCHRRKPTPPSSRDTPRACGKESLVMGQQWLIISSRVFSQLCAKHHRDTLCRAHG